MRGRLAPIGVSFSLVFYLLLGASWTASVEAAELEPTLVEGAKQEAELTVWAPGMWEQLGIIDRFKKKYPFVRKVDAIRIASERIRDRLLAESRAGVRSNVDVIGLNGFAIFYLHNKGFFAPYQSPEAGAIMEGFKDPRGYWTAYYINTVISAYNTKLVDAKDLPRNWEDLLQPKWKGKIAFFAEEYEWFANFLKVAGRKKGLAFMRQFAEQDLQYKGGHALMVQLLAAGEFPLLAVAYAPRVTATKALGAPIDWFALDPVFSNPTGISIYASARHPNTAKLFIDFVLSREIQQEIWVNKDWKGSARKDVTPKDHRLKSVKVIPYDLSLVEKYEENAKEFKDIFRPGSGSR